MSPSANKVAANLRKTPLRVRYQDLEPDDPKLPAKWSRTCPACKKGILLVRRDHKTSILLKEDACILCGRRVVYTDIEFLWEKDGMTKEQVVAEVLRR